MFERDFLRKECEIPSEQIYEVIDDLLTLKVIWKKKLTINCES